MALFLVQHGKSLPENVDPQKSISEEGKKEISLIAEVARGYGVQVGDILHSGKKRAVQTAEIIASILNIKGSISTHAGLLPLSDVKTIAHFLEVRKNLMLVGHLPMLERLLSYLITGSENYSIFKFQNGGIICLEQQKQEPVWFIKWALMPNIS
jgi:phosphohistidine phosphatase